MSKLSSKQTELRVVQLKSGRRGDEVCVPANLVLSPLVICSMIRKLSTEVIRDIVAASIDELDARTPDCDCEPSEDNEASSVLELSFAPPVKLNPVRSNSSNIKMIEMIDGKNAFRKRVLSLLLGMIFILTVGAKAQTSGLSSPPSYDLTDLVLNASIIGKSLSVIAPVRCRNETDCYVESEYFKKVIAVDIRHVPVDVARRLITMCHYDSCIELMFGVFTGDSLGLSSSKAYGPTCQEGLLTKPLDDLDSDDRFTVACHQFVAAAKVKAFMERLAAERLQDEKNANQAEVSRFETDRGWEDVIR